MGKGNLLQFSIPMVLAWLIGDLAKTGYFVATGSPLQFWVCAIIQVYIVTGVN